ncbi:hypothetical protein SLS60_006381 [Paraconiothyrium brasiliense]|uniref:Rhodopsin domain-containing protein n=1 Tax=Paraconiothyrium brasiliense TaxID=300254 RepID=A0ABR3RAJ9_9PLEO
MFWDTPTIPALYGSIIPFLVLDVFVVVLRFTMKKRLGQKFHADDWLMIPALTGVIGLATMYFYGLGTKSLGYRYMLLPPAGTDMSSPDFVPEFAGPISRIVRTRRLEYSSLILFTATAGFIKISVLLFYRRIFTIIPSYKDARSWFFIIMITLISAWALSWIFAFVFMCRLSVQTLFTSPENLEAKCVDTFMVGYSHSISDFVSDALIILIPIPFVWKLHLPTARKLAVCGIFLMGALAAGSSLVRMIWMIWNNAVGFGDATDEERQETSIDSSCSYVAGDVNQNRRDAAEGIAQYLEGLTAQGVRCGLDKNQAYYNLYTWTIDGQGYEANIYFTGRVPQTEAADYSWYVLSSSENKIRG